MFGKNKSQFNKLMKAIYEDDVVKVKSILEKYEVDLTRKGEENDTPLLSAVILGNYDMAKVILESGGKTTVNEFNDLGETPLLSAALMGKTSLVELLVENGAEVDLASRDQEADMAGRTPLMNACTCPYDTFIDTISYLLDNGADPNLTDKQGKTAAFHLLESNNMRSGAGLLSGFGAQPGGLLAGLGDIGKILDIEQQVETGELEKDDSMSLKAMKLLHSRGVNLHCKDNNGKSLLDYAKEYDCNDIVDYLLQNT